MREFHGPGIVGRILRDPADAIEGVHPLGQVMVVLPVPIPLQALVKGFAELAFIQLLTDPQAPHGRVQPAFLLIEAADPSTSRVIIAVPTENAMHLIHQLQCEISVPFFPGLTK